MAMGHRLNKIELRQEKLKNIISGNVSKSELNDLSNSNYNLNFTLIKKEVTILFVDIANFSKIAKRLGPQKTFKELSQFMNQLAEIVEKYDGKIDRSLGDGALVVFGYDKSHNDHSINAFKAAIAIQKHTVESARLKRAKSLPVFTCRIGMNRTEAHIGNLGGRSRMDYTVIGDGVNFASRLENSCNPFKIMLGETSKQIIESSNRDIRFSKAFIKIKHEDALAIAFEYDPFLNRHEQIKDIHLSSFEYLNKAPLHIRHRLIPSYNVRFKTPVNEISVYDVSLRVGATSDTLFGRTTIMDVEIMTESAAANSMLEKASLHTITVEVRWSQSENNSSSYKVGLRIRRSDEQKNIIMAALVGERASEIPAS